MKGRKILSAIIAGAMVLGTMSFPVFAESDTLPEAVDGVITLTEDVKLGSDFDYNANGGSLTIDLAGYNLKLTGNTILKNGVYTIKNGTVDVENVECTSREGLIRIAPHSDDSATLNMDKVTVKANGYNAQCGLFQFETPGKLNLNKVTINAANVTDGYGVFYSSPGNPSSLTMNEVTMTVTGANKLIYGCNAVITDSNISAQVEKDVFSAVSPVITDSTLTVEAGRAVFNDAKVYITTATVINSTITPAGTLTSGIVNNTNASSKIILDSVSDIGTTEGVCTASASIGSNLYSSLADALAAAQAGEVITLLDDVEPTLPRQSLLTNAEAIDLNNKTLTLNDYDYYWGPMTFANGTINVKTESFPGTAVFWQHDNEVLTFSAVEVNAPRLTGCYLIGSDGNDADINIINDSVINVANPLVAVIASNSTSEITIEESTVNADSTGGHAILANGATVVNLGSGAKLNADGVACGIYFSSNGTLNITDDAVVNITHVIGDPAWNASKAGIYLASNTTYNDEETGTTVNADVYRNESAETVAEEIAVTFKETDVDGKYDIVLKAAGGMNIYELVSAEIQFVNAGNGYEISGTDDINVIPNTANTDRYGFYLKDGAVANRKTGTEIKIGTVTFPEQGAINFKVEANNSTVVATEYNTHLEKSYTAADANAKLTADANGINSTIAAKTRNVLVKVDYAHKLVGSWNDNQITVTLKDAFGVTSEAKDISDGEEAFADVPVGRITVTLKAPGFRTYTYTTTVEEGTDPLVLSFWNDTKRDTTAEVEDGKAMTKNFVVGDIAMDYTVDKYDLAAVTSYYGTYNLTDENKIRYDLIRYDLNRDGSIDITDVAYVLHNFGF